MLADSLEGVRSVGAVKTDANPGRPRLRGTAALIKPPPIIVVTNGWAIAGRVLEGAPSVGAVKWC